MSFHNTGVELSRALRDENLETASGCLHPGHPTNVPREFAGVLKAYETWTKLLERGAYQTCIGLSYRFFSAVEKEF